MTAITLLVVSDFPISPATVFTAEISAEPSVAEGVPTAIKTSSASLIASATSKTKVRASF